MRTTKIYFGCPCPIAIEFTSRLKDDSHMKLGCQQRVPNVTQPEVDDLQYVLNGHAQGRKDTKF